jgi:hypothetical protein
VDISAVLAADLTQLTEALADPGADLNGMVAGLHENLAAAISSATGLAITVRVAGTEVCVSTVGSNLGISTEPPAVTSLAVPLWWPDDTRSGSITFYASAPGALADLAADLEWLFGEQESLALDRDLPPPRGDLGITGLHELSVIGQACGVLMTRGRSPEAARAELDHAALASDTTVGVIADRLIRGLRPASRPFPE